MALQKRETGYSENIFKNTNINNNTIGSIDGATALKLDDQLEVKSSTVNLENTEINKSAYENLNQTQDNSSKGISIENASYIENNLEVENHIDKVTYQEDHTPQLFSEENNVPLEDDNMIEGENTHSDKLFDQNSTDEEDFEIPAFLRKQKF